MADVASVALWNNAIFSSPARRMLRFFACRVLFGITDDNGSAFWSIFTIHKHIHNNVKYMIYGDFNISMNFDLLFPTYFLENIHKKCTRLWMDLISDFHSRGKHLNRFGYICKMWNVACFNWLCNIDSVQKLPGRPKAIWYLVEERRQLTFDASACATRPDEIVKQKRTRVPLLRNGSARIASSLYKWCDAIILSKWQKHTSSPELSVSFPQRLLSFIYATEVDSSLKAGE